MAKAKTSFYIDENVVRRARISAALQGKRDSEVVVCPHLPAELTEVLSRPPISTRVPEAQARAFVRAVREGAVYAPDPRDPPTATRDPKDDYLVALARKTQADLIVSGDRHLWRPRSGHTSSSLVSSPSYSSS
jgi:predicted nucleic acid-binding protein